MSETACMLCKTVIHTIRFSIDHEYTKHSNLLLRVVLEGVFEYKIALGKNLHVCRNCCDLTNELDAAETSYKKLRQKVLGYFNYTQFATNKCNAYCQTDVFIGNVIDYDLQGKIKTVNEDAVSSEQENYSHNFTIAEENIQECKKFGCHICFKKFISKSGLTMHMKRLHNDLPAENNLVTLNNDDLIEPKTEQNAPDNLDESEEEASEESQSETKKFTRSNRGRRKKHPDVLKPYQCTACPKTWKTSAELKNHLSAHSDVRPFICEICGQAYKHKTALDIHVGMHNGIYPFRCTYCKKSFTQKGALHRHMPIHTGETPYQCDLCGKRFVHHTSFNIHQLSHSGQKDHKCPQCGLALLSGSHLKRHMRVHTGEKNYACNLCDKKFAERYNLISHQKLHEKTTSSSVFKRNHRCQICGITYYRRLKLDEHMARDHQKVIETNIPAIQLFTKTESDSSWPTVYNKSNGVLENSY